METRREALRVRAEDLLFLSSYPAAARAQAQTAQSGNERRNGMFFSIIVVECKSQ
jgi:hypothetical protein